jgi:hypothetical protein
MLNAEKSRFFSGKKYILIALSCLTAFLLVSCSGAYTEISGSWKKPGYAGKKFNNILVVVIHNELVKRSSVESAFVKELSTDKIKASTSASVLDFSKIERNADGKLDSAKREEVKKKISDAGYDGAIVVSLLDIKEKTEYVPGQTYYQPNYYAGYSPYYYGGFYNYSFNTYSVVSEPGYYVNKTYIYIETRLFDLQTDDMVWASNSETMSPSNLSEFSKSLSSAVVTAMITDRAIK